ncbi:type IV secretion system protein VirB11 [Peptococcaceae bacterium CEB3]|nr:type IV secretion system protein VirB11 [Peptococcaceae bacterium CEB3]
MPKINLITEKVVTTGINLQEEAIIKARANPSQDPIQTAMAAIREQLVRDDLIRAKWEHRKEIESKIRVLVQEQSLLESEKGKLLQMVLDDLFGFGFLEKYRKDGEITEIIINGPHTIMIEKGGTLYDVRESFADAEDLSLWFDTHIMVMSDGKRHFDENTPLLDMETRDGERIQATRPPVTEYITVNVRKAASQTRYFSAKDFVNLGSASEEEMEFLLNAVRNRLTVMVFGRTGSGKTALVRELIEEGISDDEYVIFIEDTRETNARKKRFLSLQTVERENEEQSITMSKLFKAAMRKRPDRVCVSEIRGEEAAPFLRTTASGHPGPITTMHAGNPKRAVFLLMFYLKLSGQMDMDRESLEEFIREQIHIMVFIDRFRDGSRKITQIVEVNPIDSERGKNGEPFTTLFALDPVTKTHQKLADLSPERQLEIQLRG